eukprot:354069-Chlamydomonas_euryale.AAC.10
MVALQQVARQHHVLDGAGRRMHTAAEDLIEWTGNQPHRLQPNELPPSCMLAERAGAGRACWSCGRPLAGARCVRDAP